MSFRVLKTFVVIVLWASIATKIFCANNIKLKDSIVARMDNQPEWSELDNIFETIWENRRDLGEDYAPLLREYLLRVRKAGYKKGEMKAYDFIGLQYRYQEMYDTAFYYHNKSLELAVEEQDSAQMIYNYNNLGQVFRKQDITPVAIEYFHKALEISDAVGNIRSSSYTMNVLGTTLVVQKDYARAMYYFKLSAAIASRRKDNRTLAYNYGSIGGVYLVNKQADSAMHYFQISHKLLVELGSEEGMGVAEHLIGQAYVEQKEYAKAGERFKLALKYHRKQHNLRYQSFCYNYLARIAIEQGNFDEAIGYLDLAKEQALEIHSLKNLVKIFNNYTEVYKALSQWRLAYEANLKSVAYNDSILNEKNNKTIQALEIAYKTKGQKQRITLLTAENKVRQQRTLLLTVITIVLLLAIFIGVLDLIRRRKRNAQQQQMLKQQVLRMQMNPHFLFNALGSIQNYMYKNETEKAAGYLNNFALLTRAILEHTTQEFISLDDEIKTLRNYLELEQMRTNHSFDYQINCDDTLDVEFIEIPPMLIQPFVENAVKHGLRNLKYPGLLIVEINEVDDLLYVSIVDNGHGVQEKVSHEKGHRSMSMHIFEKRRKFLSRQLKKDIYFAIQNMKDEGIGQKGTKVKIQIPLKQ